MHMRVSSQAHACRAGVFKSEDSFQETALSSYRGVQVVTGWLLGFLRMHVYLPSLTFSRTFKGLLKSWGMIMFLRWKHHLDSTRDCKAGEGTLLGHI